MTRSGATPALMAVLAAQAASSVTTRFLPTLAPVLLPRAGWEASDVGWLSVLMALASMLFLLVGSPVVRRLGSLGSLQFGLVVAAAGVGLAVLPAGSALVLAAVLIGLGSAPCTSAGSELLQRLAPPGRRNLVFSVKQACVPVGGVLAGLALPAVSTRWGIAGAVVLTAVFCVLVALAMERGRPVLDAMEVRKAAPAGTATLRQALLAPLDLLVRSPALRRLGLAGFCLGVGHGAWMAYFVSYLVDGLGWTLVAAGSAFAVMQGVSIVARPAVGWLSDATNSSRRMLAWLGAAAGAATAVLAAMGTDTPAWLVTALALFAGATVSSWNGLHLAETARASPSDKVAEGTSSTALLVYFGMLAGPALFGLTVAAGGGMRAGFVVCGILTSAAAVALARSGPVTARPARASASISEPPD